MINYLLYVVYLVFAIVVKITPKTIIKYILILLSKFIYIVDIKHRKIALINLDLAYMDTITNLKKRYIVKKSYENLVFNLYEFVKIQNKTLKDMEKDIILKDELYILNAIKENKQIILVTAHYGAWELAIPYISLKFRPIAIISKPIKNKYINELFKKARKAHNLEMFEKHGAAKKMLKALKDNKIVAMAIDQNIAQKDGVAVKFFNNTVTQTDSPIRLASKVNAVVIPFMLVRHNFDTHEAVFYKPLDIDQNLNQKKIIDYSQNISNIFEEQIRRDPTNWFWQHKRFKAFYKDIYER